MWVIYSDLWHVAGKPHGFFNRFGNPAADRGETVRSGRGVAGVPPAGALTLGRPKYCSIGYKQHPSDLRPDNAPSLKHAWTFGKCRNDPFTSCDA
jgi:hypothetical protein